MKLSSSVHFVGISGIGMSALARILLQRGYRVSGSSDRATALTERLSAEGARVCIGHASENLDGAATVVVSSAISEDNRELAAARERGLSILHRGALLATLMAERRGIAIAGTHGKTTMTAMIAAVLEAGGLDPTVAVGGERGDTKSNARDGAGAWFVAEADESDLSFLDLHPEIAVVANIENDHVDSDADIARLVAAFERFVCGVPSNGLLLLGADDRRAAALARAGVATRTRTFGFGADADIRARDVVYAGFGSQFTVTVDGDTIGAISLRVPGAINIVDALPALAVGRELGVPFATIGEALARFAGVRRRFDIRARSSRLTVVDDYAHHPTAIAATIEAARAAFDGPLVAVFQPHRYTRTSYLGGAFARALQGADHVVLTDIYAASEPPLPGVDATTIGAPLAALGTEVAYVRAVADVPAYVLAHAPRGALVLMLGAGSISDAAAVLAEAVLAEAGAAAGRADAGRAPR
ncbi:MAG: UDP-N-acetylmuramate--L-alanine ligase [Candidatus Eremiobacteraeota bacterium]|nr:UDP-N-acetylmuramate--L-alanine ligase [Candidatus Eremiobacteraeota bacterium]